MISKDLSLCLKIITMEEVMEVMGNHNSRDTGKILLKNLQEQENREEMTIFGTKKSEFKISILKVIIENYKITYFSN